MKDNVFAPYRVLAFDLDETLVTLDVPWAEVLQRLKAMFDKDYGRVAGVSKTSRIHGLIAEMMSCCGMEAKSKAQAVIAPYEKRASYTVHPWLIDVLRHVPQPVVIYSNNGHDVLVHIVNQLGLQSNVALVLGYEDVTWFKPHPEGMKKILEHFRLQPHELLFVGDKDTDQQVAESCAVPFHYVQDLQKPFLT